MVSAPMEPEFCRERGSDMGHGRCEETGSARGITQRVCPPAASYPQGCLQPCGQGAWTGRGTDSGRADDLGQIISLSDLVPHL